MKECNYFIDSNIFLRVLVRDEEKTFKDCLEFLKNVKKNNIQALTSFLVLAEVNWTLRRYYNFSKEKIVASLYSILNLRNLKIVNNINPRLAMKIFEKHNVKFIDALIASNQKIYEKEMVVVSYDKDFDKIGVLRKKPRQLLK